MDLKEFLSRLRGVKGPNASGEYMARCPAHDDKTASLCVREGEKGIVLKCQTGRCSTQDIVSAMGLSMKDLFRESKSRKSDKKTFVCAYRYTDEDGKLLYEACRYRYENGQKTFLLRQPDPGKPGEYKYTKAGVRMVLYRLPEVLKAIKEGRPVIVCEGEKDADTLTKMGYTATTNAMGAGKWSQGYTESLKGADVIILPDNDQPGEDHARMVATNIRNTAKSVRIAWLKDVIPDLKAKADISDVAADVGLDRAGQLLDEAIAKSVIWEKLPEAEPDPELMKLRQLYQQAAGYTVSDDWRIMQVTADGEKPLANFVALPVMTIERDDGVKVQSEMLIDGWSQGGKKLRRARIDGSKFGGMSWAQETWGFDANILPGNAVKDKVRYVISEAGRRNVERVTEYAHTGWRKVDGKWAYLYQGGAIGADGVTVALEGNLSRYSLEIDEGSELYGLPLETYGLQTMDLLNHMKRHLAVPLLGVIFLAPLRSFLVKTGSLPAFSLFLLGSTQTGKTSAAALALSHFGDFDAKSVPCSFSDTANKIRRSAFLMKDMPLLIDDYHPSSSMVERRRMETVAQELSRAFGDGSGRGRLNSDQTVQQQQPPRALSIITGEDLPQVGESGVARFFIVRVSEGDFAKDMDTTNAMEMARMGALRGSMRGYIEWLIPQIPKLPEKLRRDFLINREKAQALMGGKRARSAEAVAHILLGYQMMLEYMKTINVLNEDEAGQHLRDAWKAVTELSMAQVKEAKEERPSKRFLNYVTELLTTKACWVKDLISIEKSVTGKEMIGYIDSSYYYLMPQVTFKAVQEICQRQGDLFPLSAKALFKQLQEDGVISQDAMGRDTTTKVKWVDGRAQRLLWIPREKIDGGGENPAKQMEMDLTEQDDEEDLNEVFPD